METYELPQGVTLPNAYKRTRYQQQAFILGAQDGFSGDNNLADDPDYQRHHSGAEAKAYARGYDAGKAARQ